MSIPGLGDYDESELQKARSLSPALSRYFNLLGTSAKSNDPAAQFRLMRHTSWCQAATATLLDRAEAKSVCKFWSQAADELIQRAWNQFGASELGLAVFALGKLGSQELNLSSDVDLMIISRTPAGHEHYEVLRKFTHLLAAVTEYGFCLRIDTDLRPGGRLGPLISSVNQAEDYYWTQGATWERMALVRLRPIAGDSSVINDVIKIVSKFSYRRFLDYTLFEELKGLRSQIHWLAEEKSNHINLKLGRGGIRDIELFVHALQVIHGGRLPSLQTTSTDCAFEQVLKHSILNKHDLSFLHTTYWFMRSLENKVQAIGDQQTHLWTDSAATALGLQKRTEEVKNSSQRVDGIVQELLGKAKVATKALPESEDDQQSLLTELGFNKRSVEETWPNLIELTALSTKTQRDEKARRHFLYLFVNELHKKGLDIDLGLELLLDFVRATRAKATFFTLLVRQPALITNLSLLFSTSPYLGRVVASRPELIDSFIYRVQSEFSKDFNTCLEELAEARLLGEIISANQFLADKDVGRLSQQLTASADDICETLLERLQLEYGDVDLDILCLGKWGGQELGLRSDLDFVFLSPSPGERENKIARRFISRLTDQHRGGQIFAIDLRLRPSGRVGPLLLSPEQLYEYLQTRAQPWELQSYLRARSLKGFAYRVQSIITSRGLSAEDLKELKTIRSKLLRPFQAESIDLKYAPGGLVDIELAVQTACLSNKILPTSTNTLGMLADISNNLAELKPHTQLLMNTYRKLRQLEQIFQLTASHSGARLQTGSESFQRLGRFLRVEEPDLMLQLQAELLTSSSHIQELDPIHRQV